MKRILILMMFLLLCCGEKNNNNFDRSLNKLIENSVLEKNSSYYDDILLFSEKNEKKGIMIFNLNTLRKNYFGKYNSVIINQKTFEQYIRAVLKGEYLLSEGELIYRLYLNDNIKNDYENVDFKVFKEKYIQQKLSSTSYILKNKELNKQELYTLLYFFFINGYFTEYDEYTGYFITRVIFNEILPANDNPKELEPINF